ncbi:accessory factor UbiK family protein [Microvirga sp. W0021]|uniref:Accessory factor UbiK family protein n=1 Tax=Hohaiivirga grylli TaxID=3133970 RepID=A0ABV0BJS7_9HYPH
MDPNKNRIFDEFAKLTTDAIGAAQGLKREAETIVKNQAEKMMRNMDFASNEEVSVLREMISNLKQENAALLKRVEKLEAKQSKPAPKTKATK